MGVTTRRGKLRIASVRSGRCPLDTRRTLVGIDQGPAVSALLRLWPKFALVNVDCEVEGGSLLLACQRSRAALVG